MRIDRSLRPTFVFAVFAAAACSPLPAATPEPTPIERPAESEHVKGNGAHGTHCGGNTACPSGYLCIDDPSDACDPKHVGDCTGVCVAVACTRDKTGGKGCQQGYECVEDPSEACDPAAKATCKGICSMREAQRCGGYERTPCPGGFTCTDDATDGCLGPTCPGVCLSTL